MSASQEIGLYRRFELGAAPTKKFLMCGCEASADAAAKLLGHIYVPVTWPQAPGAWQWVDVTALKGREGLLIPDGTPDSRQDMLGMAARLHGLGIKLRITSTEDRPPDWCLCDWQGSTDEFIARAKAKTVDYTPPETAPKPPEVPPEATQEPPRRRKPRLAAVDGNAALEPSPEREAAPIPLSENDFAARFADEHGANWRCVETWGKWFHWDGEAWAEDRTSARVQPMRELFTEARDWPEAREMTQSSKRAALGRLTPMYNALRLAGTDKRVRAVPEIWDADPWALGVPGGVIDLKTGSLKASAREQHVTMRCSIRPERGVPKNWLRCLEQWQDDPSVIGFMRRYMGYALTGDSREQCMAFFYGPAQSGKGTILRAISGIMGSTDNRFRSYHYEAPISTFMESRSDKHTTELAALYKKRLITSEEPTAGSKWDEGKLKWLTGGSLITARFIGKDNFSFAMTGKIIVAANHRPRLATTDKSIRRRMMVIPFEHPVQDEDRDNDLDAKLTAEWPQILHWMIEGCMEWQAAGLGLPERIQASTDQYLEIEDTLGAWLEECTERDTDTAGASLYDSYAQWCKKNGDSPWGRRGWTNALIERGFTTRKGTGGARMIRSLSLKPGALLP